MVGKLMHPFISYPVELSEDIFHHYTVLSCVIRRTASNLYLDLLNYNTLYNLITFTYRKY